MARMLLQTKRYYMNYVSKYMHENHISFKTLEETKQTWRTERAYDVTIEEELINVSKLFMSLLDKQLNLQFRQRMINFIANYLAVYVSKSKEFAEFKDSKARFDRAYVKINNNLLIWLNSNLKKQDDTNIKPVTIAPKYKKRVLQQDNQVVQEITFEKEKLSFVYDSMAEYRKKYRTDLERAISVYAK